jgi:mono/diheme cytochrome c family protein
MTDPLELIRRSFVILLLAGTFVHGQTPVTYDDHIFPQIFQPRCILCHGAGLARGGRRFDTYANAISNGADVRAKVTIQNGSMPENQADLSPTLQALIGQWITDGSLESAPPDPVADAGPDQTVTEIGENRESDSISGKTPPLQHSNTPTLQHSNTPTYTT